MASTYKSAKSPFGGLALTLNRGRYVSIRTASTHENSHVRTALHSAERGIQQLSHPNGSICTPKARVVALNG